MIARIVGELGAHLRRLPGSKRVTFSGELMDDAETVLTTGKPMTRMSVAVPLREAHGHTDHEYIAVVAFDGCADFCARCCRAGRSVLVEGRERTYKYARTPDRVSSPRSWRTTCTSGIGDPVTHMPRTAGRTRRGGRDRPRSALPAWPHRGHPWRDRRDGDAQHRPDRHAPPSCHRRLGRPLRGGPAGERASVAHRWSHLLRLRRGREPGSGSSPRPSTTTATDPRPPTSDRRITSASHIHATTRGEAAASPHRSSSDAPSSSARQVAAYRLPSE